MFLYLHQISPLVKFSSISGSPGVCPPVEVPLTSFMVPLSGFDMFPSNSDAFLAVDKSNKKKLQPMAEWRENVMEEVSSCNNKISTSIMFLVVLL